MIRLLTGSISLYIVTALAMASPDYSLDAFNTGLEKFKEDSTMVDYCREFVEHASEIDVIREAQNKWNRVDHEGALAYFDALADQNPESPKHQYLKGRIAESKFEQVELGRRVIELDPEWAYGYRLLFAGYVTGLFDKRGNSKEKKQLEEELPKDEHQFQKLLEIDGPEDYSLRFMKSYHTFKKDYKSVLSTLEKAQKLEAEWVNGYEFAKVYFELGDNDRSLTEVKGFIDDKIALGDFLPAERQAKIDGYYTALLRSKKMYDEVIAYYEDTPGFSENDRALFAVARIYALKEETDKAFEFLYAAAEKGWGRVEVTEKNRDLADLKDDPRWPEVIEKMEKAWEEGTDEREVETLAGKVDKEAYDWALTTVEGDTVRLSDLSGEVIILDFWATWCGPCMSAMPVIDEWVKTKMHDDVKVYSVNIWERNLDKAKTTMTDNDYAMTLLFGNDSIADAYGIESIPYICAIDKQGRIRYEENGYSQGLEEMLEWWVRDLSQ